MEIVAAEDIFKGTDMFPPLCPIAFSLYDSFLSTHCSCCFSLLSPDPSQSLYCSAACSLTDSAIVFPQLPLDISPVLPSDIRTALRLLYSIPSSFSAVVTALLPHRFGGLLTNHHRLMADSSISLAIRRAADVLRSQANWSDSDRKNTELEEAAICSVLTNAVEVQDSTGRALGIAVYEPRFSWINHSCSPNACYRFLISPPHSITTSYQDDDLVSPKIIPHINKTEKEEEIGVCSLTSLWEGKTVGYGPKVIARSIKRIKNGEEITVSYIDLLQPTGLRQSDLWSKYRFMCSCIRCAASPPAYVDSILEGNTNKDEAVVGKMTDDIEEAIDYFLSDKINPKTCCEKIENVLLHGWLHPIHHVALNAYITLSTAYRIRSIDSVKAFDMRRISAAYSFFLACVSHHLLSAEPSLAISASNFWKSAGESLLDLSPGEEPDVKCTKCHMMLETPNSMQLLRCITDISQVAWSFLTRGCPYLQKFRSPVDFSLTGKTNGGREEESSEDQRVSILLLSFHCLLYADFLNDLCYGYKSHLVSLYS